MKKNGFTLVEILAVIVIIAIVTIIAIPAIGGTSKNIKAEMCNGKLKTVKEAAKLYAEDYYNGVDLTFTIRDVVEKNYISCDEKGKTFEDEDCMLNPINNESLLDFEFTATVTEHKRISISYQKDESGNIIDPCKVE